MKARRRKPNRSRAKSPFVVLGAVIGTIPARHASERRITSTGRLMGVPHNLPRQWAEL